MTSVEESIAKTLSKVAAVEAVHVAQDGGVYRVYTVTDGEDALERIYDEERGIIRRFHDLQFDFNVVARRSRPLDQLLTLATPIWQRSGDDAPCPNATSI